MLEAGSHLLGRVTYESFAGAWPEREGPMADKMNSMPKYVVSSTLAEPLAWNNSTVIQGDVAEEVGKLKEQDGGPILVAGSATLVHSLIENDLVDELRLMVFPVMIGGGHATVPGVAAEEGVQAGGHPGVRLGRRRPDVRAGLSRTRGDDRNRTGVKGFAGPRVSHSATSPGTRRLAAEGRHIRGYTGASLRM